MRGRGPANGWRGRAGGIILLILGLVHLPLPQPDFHNIRHHDGQGEVCEFHDHLLRWHPGAGVASDVAVLHWHWFLPGAEPSPEGLGNGLAVHAHSPDWPAGAWSDDGPRVAPSIESRPLDRPALNPLDPPVSIAASVASASSPVAGIHPPLAFGATFAPGVSLTSLLHRWIC